ncbi:uncharacterized protein LOC104897127 [Beta vulgaris subsp. vulgaris]|uniref:uncharacterized protein LOC104897127 n=1 Tax=Beta vulgaris subsp. vulgaris TaxID=3555 RepID=UPI0020373F08|nr:uncharacterized protein LOC104897127 [Beta vulgaris subsp. vulgaris]
MKVHSTKSSIVAKRLWNFLRITFLMMRKGLISKKKLIMDINLFFKRGKLIRKSLSNLLHLHHHHHHHGHQMTRGSFARREYEFSCSNSPNPVFFHVSSSKRKHNHHHHHQHHHIHFPCINSPLVLDELESQDNCDIDHVDDNNAMVLMPKTPEYAFNLRLDGYDLAPGEIRSPITTPFPIMISDYSSEDEHEEGNIQVDYEAEEFIKKFYDQLRAQSRVQLLQY